MPGSLLLGFQPPKQRHGHGEDVEATSAWQITMDSDGFTCSTNVPGTRITCGYNHYGFLWITRSLWQNHKLLGLDVGDSSEQTMEEAKKQNVIMNLSSNYALDVQSFYCTRAMISEKWGKGLLRSVFDPNFIQCLVPLMWLGNSFKIFRDN